MASLSCPLQPASAAHGQWDFIAVTLETVRGVTIEALSHTLALNLRHSPPATACRDSTGSVQTDSLVWTLSPPCGRIHFPGFKYLPHADKDQTHTQVLTSPELQYSCVCDIITWTCRVGSSKPFFLGLPILMMAPSHYPGCKRGGQPGLLLNHLPRPYPSPHSPLA